MKRSIKTIIYTALAGVIALNILGGCANTSANESVTAASDTTSVEQTSDTTSGEQTTILAEQGITLDIVTIEDSVTPNVGVADGSLDANYFQHQPYLDQYNEENGTDIVSAGAIHYEPFGIYAGKTTSLEDLPDGAIVAVPNNVTNEARALLLLQQEGLITLADGVGINATVNDIASNPKNIQIEEIAPEQLVRSLPDVDIAIINGNYAIEGGLKVADALAVEANDGLAAQTYGNIIAVRAEDADNPAIKKLVEVLQSPEISEYINETYGGAVVPLN